MKKHTRAGALLLATLLLASSLAGCGGRGDDNATNATRGETHGETGTSSTDGTASDSDTDASESADESTSESESETEPEPEPDDGTDAPRGYLRLYKPKELSTLRRVHLDVQERKDATGEFLHLLPTGQDPQLILANGDRQAVKNATVMRIKYRTKADIVGRLYLGEREISEAGALSIPYTGDGEWHTVTITLTQSSTYAEMLRCVRLDPSDGKNPAAEQMDIAWIAFYPEIEDPTANLPALPEDTPNLSNYEKTPDGSAHYRVSGALSGSNGTYTFKENFKLDVYRRGYFNRYTLGYSSTSPIKGEITYLLWDGNGKQTTHKETFFLEAGNNKTFSSLIDGYFGYTFAWGISAITMKTCDGSTASFKVQSISDDKVEVQTGTYYLENGRYKLGILLSWGGGISYIEDKQDGDDQLKNLINRADPGRLVQQSYYGIKSGSGYTPGNYNGTEWRYNPVQGGDMYGNGSKLVDFRVLEDGRSVYIKCRPMDWAKNNEPTPSYMENTYTLSAEGIHVSNRFVDFMGVTHPAYHAELPAFYTVSYLGTFHYYNGTKPWTGDGYITLPNEPFWAGNKNAYHKIVAGNTETWAAWTNTAGYGIGLYVPGVEQMLAGRYEYNGSKDPANGGTSYVAPLRTMTMVSFKPFEYEYIIATGTVAEMRETFKKFAG